MRLSHLLAIVLAAGSVVACDAQDASAPQSGDEPAQDGRHHEIDEIPAGVGRSEPAGRAEGAEPACGGDTGSALAGREADEEAFEITIPVALPLVADRGLAKGCLTYDQNPATRAARAQARALYIEQRPALELGESDGAVGGWSDACAVRFSAGDLPAAVDAGRCIAGDGGAVSCSLIVSVWCPSGA